MAAIRLEGLHPQAYEHPSDAAALKALQHTLGFDKLIQKLNAWGLERIIRVQLTGSYLRVTKDSFSDLYYILAAARSRLDIHTDVDLYIATGSAINALTVGVERPLIILNTAAVEHLTLDELTFVIAHELGHIKSRHVLYYQIAEYLPVIAGIFGTVTLGVGELLSTPLELALLHWKRMAEFTADRAGLLACQDVEVAWRTMVKLAGLPPKYYAELNTQDFLKQARDFKDLDADTLSKIAKWLSSLGDSHPWMVVRAQQLDLWISDGSYEKVLKFPMGLAYQLPPTPANQCKACSMALRGTETFCPRCGFPLKPSSPPPLPGRPY